MLFNQKITSVVLCAMLLSLAQNVGAYGLTWIDKDYDFSKLVQVTCLPMEKNAPYSADTNLLKESKKVKTEFNAFYDLNLDKK